MDWGLTCKSKGHWLNSWSSAHAWVVGQVPGEGHVRGNHTLMFLSLPSVLLEWINKIFFKTVKNKKEINHKIQGARGQHLDCRVEEWDLRGDSRHRHDHWQIIYAKRENRNQPGRGERVLELIYYDNDFQMVGTQGCLSAMGRNQIQISWKSAERCQGGPYLALRGTWKPESSRKIGTWADKMDGIYKRKTWSPTQRNRIQPGIWS